MTFETEEQAEALRNLIGVGRRLAVLAGNLANMGQNGVTDPRLREILGERSKEWLETLKKFEHTVIADQSATV